MQWKRLSVYLFINIVVSALTTIVVLTVWDRSHRAEYDRLASEAALPSAVITEPTETVSQPAVMPTIPLQPHQVRTGETLSDIALEYGMSVDEILEINGLTDADSLGAGQLIYVPATTETTTSALQTPESTQAESADRGQIEIVSIIGAGDLGTERLMLRDVGGGKHVLSGWQLTDEDGHIYTFPQATLYENGQIVVNTKAGVDNPLELFWGLGEAVWVSGEIATLYDSNGQVRGTFQVP